MKDTIERCRGRKLARLLALLACLFYLAIPSPAAIKFDRTYNIKGQAHLTVANINGAITVTAWNRRAIAVSAINEPSAAIAEQVSGDEISLTVKKAMPPGKVSFQIFVPADTDLRLNNYLGRIEVRGVRGDVSIKSYDSEVHLIDAAIPSVDVNVTTGSIFFDGDLTGDGPYTLQTLNGDVDVSLPATTSFQLSTRALSEKINLGGFLNSLSSENKAPKSISGTHLKGGPRLSLIAFTGRILLHKK
ncbi:MAG: hypothetical protein HY231_01265 [Acidobacteria bacterium]|nr:hypothetical protein [Acidobacteriota bacterium]